MRNWFVAMIVVLTIAIGGSALGLNARARAQAEHRVTLQTSLDLTRSSNLRIAADMKKFADDDDKVDASRDKAVAAGNRRHDTDDAAIGESQAKIELSAVTKMRTEWDVTIDDIGRVCDDVESRSWNDDARQCRHDVAVYAAAPADEERLCFTGLRT